MCAFLFTGNWFQSIKFIFERVWQVEEVLKILDSIFTLNFLLSQTLVCEYWDKDMQSFKLF